jgi:Family of unknown function (DUF6527)
MNIRLKILCLFEWLGFRKRSFRVQQVVDVPDNPRPFEVYAIGDPHIWQAALLCPCGCGHLIQLSLLASDSPRWDLKVDRNGNATISPSVWRTLGCQAHFFVRGGRIIWCDHRT